MSTIDKDTPVGKGFTVGDLVQFETKSIYPGKIHARWGSPPWDGSSKSTRCGMKRRPLEWIPINGGYPCRMCFELYSTYGIILNSTRDLVHRARREVIEQARPKEDDHE